MRRTDTHEAIVTVEWPDGTAATWWCGPEAADEIAAWIERQHGQSHSLRC